MRLLKRDLTSWLLACCLAALLAPATAHAQDDQRDFGNLAQLKLKASKLATFVVSHIPPVTLTGTAQCPAVGTPAFSYNVTTEIAPGNDDITFFDKSGKPVLSITHERSVTTLEYSGKKVIQRQDWTRIKENDNGIDNKTGIRHYIGLFLEETMVPVSMTGVVTALTQGVMTLEEPLVFPIGNPLFGLVARVDVVQFIGPQASWLEPFSASDARSCGFLQDGVPRPVSPTHVSTCTVTENIVGCPPRE